MNDTAEPALLRLHRVAHLPRWATLLAVVACASLMAPGPGAASPVAASDSPSAEEAEDDEFETAGAGFALQVGEDIIPYEVMAISAMPNEDVAIDAVLGNRQNRYGATASAGTLTPKGEEGWVWKAPAEPGLYRVVVTDKVAGDSIRLQAFVLTPYDGQDVFEGYRIGAYEKIPLRKNPAYNIPKGLIRMTRELADEEVSPHFKLGQFVGKQASDYPKFLIVRTRMLLKLEMLLAEFNRAGIEADTFFLMSAYRTPFYNASIGNRTKYSRHCYGDAVDIYIDENGDGRSDDVNGDGRVDRGDAEAMARVVESLTDRTWYLPFIGGLGIYGPAPHRGPFIHVDTRGFRARW